MSIGMMLTTLMDQNQMIMNYDSSSGVMMNYTFEVN